MFKIILALNIVFVLALIGGAAVLWNINNQLSQSKVTLQITASNLQVAQQEATNARELSQTISYSNEVITKELQQSTMENYELRSLTEDLEEDVQKLYRENSYVEGLNRDLELGIRDVREENRQFESDNRKLEQELREADSANKDLHATNQEQFQRLNVARVVNSELKAENEQLNSEKQSLAGDLVALKSKNQSLNTELDATRADLSAVNQRYKELEGKSGSVDQLEERIKTLRSEIAKLEEQRKPLLVKSDVSYFRCTGSMEPKITCLDSATFLENFLPEDITVGTVIAFKPTPACKTDSESIVHRVIQVKVENGVHYYWPKGDNNKGPDNCWIPENNVRGYIIKLHKNTETRNSGLRNWVNDAQSKMDEAWATYKAKRDAYCGRGHVGTCYLPSHQLTELNWLWDVYSRDRDYYSCAVRSAKATFYLTNDSAPIYVLCIKRPVFRLP